MFPLSAGDETKNNVRGVVLEAGAMEVQKKLDNLTNGFMQTLSTLES